MTMMKHLIVDHQRAYLIVDKQDVKLLHEALKQSRHLHLDRSPNAIRMDHMIEQTEVAFKDLRTFYP